MAEAECVEGEWKNFVFKMITMDNRHKVFESLRKSFYQDEPICKYMGGSSDDLAEDFESFYETVIPDNLSFYAEDKDTHEVAGVRITMVNKNGAASNKNFKSKQIKTLMQVVAMLDQAVNFAERVGTTKYVKFITAATSQKYRGQGLATEMYKRSLKLLKAKEHKHVKGVLTSPWSRKALENIGFKELTRIYYKDFKDVDGKPLFPDIDEGLFANFMCMEL